MLSATSCCVSASVDPLKPSVKGVSHTDAEPTLPNHRRHFDRAGMKRVPAVGRVIVRSAATPWCTATSSPATGRTCERVSRESDRSHFGDTK